MATAPVGTNQPLSIAKPGTTPTPASPSQKLATLYFDIVGPTDPNAGAQVLGRQAVARQFAVFGLIGYIALSSLWRSRQRKSKRERKRWEKQMRKRIAKRSPLNQAKQEMFTASSENLFD